jgi:hypothetical protein
VLIAGEAGVGKSRLVAEVRAHAERLGFLSLVGQCFEPDRVLPYAPWLDVLRTRFAGRPSEALAPEVDATGPELVKLLPELATQLPGLAPTAPLEPEQEQRRLVQALVQFVAGLARVQPVLLVIEDLHWSDDTSLEVLLHLARRIANQPILLLLTYRTEDLHPSLSHFLAELDRGRLVRDVFCQSSAPARVLGFLSNCRRLISSIRRRMRLARKNRQSAKACDASGYDRSARRRGIHPRHNILAHRSLLA